MGRRCATAVSLPGWWVALQVVGRLASFTSASYRALPPPAPLTSCTQVGPGSDQYDFMEQTLAGIDRSVTPWVVLMGHRPMYYVDDNAAGGTLDTHFQAFESLLMKYKVDLVAWGHVHVSGRRGGVRCVPSAAVAA